MSIKCGDDIGIHEEKFLDQNVDWDNTQNLIECLLPTIILSKNCRKYHRKFLHNLANTQTDRKNTVFENITSHVISYSIKEIAA